MKFEQVYLLFATLVLAVYLVSALKWLFKHVAFQSKSSFWSFIRSMYWLAIKDDIVKRAQWGHKSKVVVHLMIRLDSDLMRRMYIHHGYVFLWAYCEDILQYLDSISYRLHLPQYDLTPEQEAFIDEYERKFGKDE